MTIGRAIRWAAVLVILGAVLMGNTLPTWEYEWDLKQDQRIPGARPRLETLHEDAGMVRWLGCGVPYRGDSEADDHGQ